MAANYSLAKTISRQVAGLRKFFDEQSFVEGFLPHLTRNQSVPFRDTFKVSAPELNFEGALRVGGSFFLAEAVSHLGRVYTIDTRFRAKANPGTHLPEFQMIEAWGDGGLEDLVKFSEGLLESQIGHLLDERSPLEFKRAKELESIKFPLRTVTYEEATKRIGLRGGAVSSVVGQQLSHAFGSQPLFVTHLPENLDPSLTDVRLDEQRNHHGFSLIVPHTGILGNGGELEVDYEILSDQIDRSNYLKELKKLGGKRSQLDDYLKNIASLEVPHFKFALGFERLTQFLIGADRIEDAALFPVHAKVEDRAAQVARRPIVIIIDSVIVIVPEPI